MVTGSHLTPEYNGFKLCIGKRSIYDANIRIIARLIEEHNFTHGHAEITADEGAYSHYIHDIEKRATMKRPLKVVVDAGNGTGGLFAPHLFKLWGHEVIGLYLDPEDDFPHHIPNPQEAENMADLAKKVPEVGADIGIAFDGDADRIGVVDEKGNLIAADRLLALLALDVLKRHPGSAVVGEVLCSEVLFDAVARAGGKPQMAASGHAIVKEAMHASGALIAGEMSGHIFIAEDYFGYDDGYMTAGRVLQLLSASDSSMSQLDDSLPRLYSTPEYRPHCPDEDKQTVIRHVGGQLKGHGEIVTIDGIRVKFERGWGLIRASNTEPVLSLRFEGQTKSDALAYRDLFARALKAFPQVGALE
jgi:phosphomannomutase/phosphoglucomutase